MKRKLEGFNEKRNEIAACWTERLQSLIEQNILRPMQATAQAAPARWGYPVICRETEIRNNLRRYLNEHGVETRPIICGNMARQPAFAHVPHRISGELKGADEIMDCGLLWGMHPLMSTEDVAYVAETVLEFAKQV